MGGFESHEEYNRLLKNSADRQFSFLQKFQETTQKNTNNLRDNVTELLLWTVHPPSPVGGHPRASTRRCARPQPCASPRPLASARPPTSTCERPCVRTCAHQSARPPVSARVHMRPPSRTGRRPPERQYKTVHPPTTMRPPSPAGFRAPPHRCTCERQCVRTCALRRVPVGAPPASARVHMRPRPPTTMRPSTTTRPPSPACLRADVRRRGRVEGVN